MTVCTFMALAAAVGFDRPWCLLAGVAAAGPILFALRARRHGRHIPAVNVALQCLAVLAAAAALAGPTAPIGAGARKPYMLLQDVSASCRGQGPSVHLPADVPANRCDFAATVVPAGQKVDPNETRVAPALNLALARRGDLAGLIVRTDGQFTDADWPTAAAELGRAGLPALIVPMESPAADGRVAELSARREPDGKVHLRATATANALMRRTLTVRRLQPSGGDLLADTLDLLAGQPVTIRLDDNVPPGQLAVYRASLSPPDELPENDSAAALVLPIQRRLAAVGAGPLSAVALAEATGLPAEQVAPAEAPRSAAGWMGYAAVVVTDATGTLLALAARRALAEFVRGGGGLVLVGAGPHESLADHDDPLNQVAALVPNPYQRRPLKVIVVLDASGTMKEPLGPSAPGRTKFDQAIEAVLSLRRHLTPADGLAVIAFSNSARRVHDSGAAPVDFAAVRQDLAGVLPGGPTDVEAALRLAAAQPDVRPGQEGLVIVLSDLLAKAFRPDQTAAMLGKARLALAVVAIASGAETQEAQADLEALAKLMSAPVVRREDLGALAEVFARFLRRARGEALRRGAFEAMAVQPALGMPAGPLPQVGAYVLCAPQARAEAIARVAADQDAIAALRRVGLGRSVSLALPVGAGENPAWQSSGELLRWVSAAARWALRPDDDPRFAGGFRRRGGELLVTVDAADAAGPMNLLNLAARVVGERGAADREDTFRLLQTAPGRYEGRAPAPDGPAGLAVSEAGGRVVWQAALAAEAPAELAAIGPQWDNLRRLAELTGGRIATAAELADLAPGLAGKGDRAAWPVLLALAVVLMLAEWAAARIWHRRA